MGLEEVTKKISEASNLELELVWLPKIMDNQTDNEKDKFTSDVINRVGLNKQDAPFVTNIYYQLKSGGHLSDKQANILRKILPKYKRQYLRMMSHASEEKV